jgi:hypothetical protein
VQKQRDYHGTVELKLGGCPWWADGNDAVESRYFVSCLLGALKLNGWEVSGSVELARHSNDKTTFLLRQCAPRAVPHMCISLAKTNRIRLIVSSSDISEESELRLTTRMNEVIKGHWVALGPRNYGKSIEWKLEGDPWDTEGLYSDQTRGIHLLCLLLGVIQPLGWRLVASADVSSKNLDNNERGYALVGKPEDLHTWFFLYDESLRRPEACASPYDQQSQQQQPYGQQQYKSTSAHDITAAGTAEKSFSPAEAAGFADRYTSMGYFPQPQPVNAYYGHPPQPPAEVGGRLAYQQGTGFSKSVPSVAAASERDFPYSPHQSQQQPQPWFESYDQPPPGPPGGMHHHPHHPYMGGSQGSLSGFGQPHPPPQATSHHGYPYYQPQYPSGLAQKPPHMRPPQQKQPCMASADRCQSKQRLLRQASAGSLPPESYGEDPFGGGVDAYSGVHRAPDQGYYYGGHHGGYRSGDGDGYRGDYPGRPASAGGGRGEWSEHEREARRSATGPHNTPAMNRWKKIVRAATIAGYGSGGGDDEEEDDEPLMRGNGYASDGEGFVGATSAGADRRISRSGRFGSQASSLCHAADVEEARRRLRKDTDEDEDAEIEHAMGLVPAAMDRGLKESGRRSATSATPQSCDDEDMEEDEEDEVDEELLNVGGDVGGPCQPDVVVSYSRYETEVAITATTGPPGPPGPGGGSSRSRSDSREGLYSTPESGGEGPPPGGGGRLRRQSSRDGGGGGGPRNSRAPPPPVRRGSAQLPPPNKGSSSSGNNNAKRSGSGEPLGRPGVNREGPPPPPPTSSGPPAGYRSEGSNESPMLEGRSRRQRQRTQPEDADLIQVVTADVEPDVKIPQSRGGSGGGGRRGEMRRQRSESRERGAPPPVPSAFGGVNSSKSLNSFDRQESSGSFHSGHSTHSAPSASAAVPSTYPAPLPPPQPRHGYGGGGGDGGVSSKAQQAYVRSRPSPPIPSLPPQQPQHYPYPAPPPPQHQAQQYPQAYQLYRHYPQPPQPPRKSSRHASGYGPAPAVQGGGSGGYHNQIQQQGMESCSTQSSSSSASVPPDYATCYPHQQPPPYDQAFDVYSRQQQAPYRHRQHQAAGPPPPPAAVASYRGSRQLVGHPHMYYPPNAHQPPGQPPPPPSRKSSRQPHGHPQAQSTAAAAAAGQRSQSGAAAAGVTQRYRENQLHYMGEFYG